MLLVTLTLKTLLSISQNGISPITINKQLGNHLNKDIINASISFSSFLFVDASKCVGLRATQVLPQSFVGFVN